MNEADWYEVAEGSALLQGDVLMQCPVFLPTGEFQWPLPPDTETSIRIKLVDVVVMTQSCDLANDKVAEVLLARLMGCTSESSNRLCHGR